jgi:8-oxo-dGTP pyrophosphatase MutT (NUDIX family)
MVPLTISIIESRLRSGTISSNVRGEVRKRAAVAIVLRDHGGQTEVLLIRRAERAGDPWSGHVAFPGGRASPADASIEATAIRETKEEIGLDLEAAGARLIGRLPDQQPLRRVTGLAITPVLFEVQGDPPLTPDAREVAATCWVPLSALDSGIHDGRMVYWWRPLLGIPLPFPFILSCWRYQGFTIWGLTYRMLSEMLRIARAST